MFTFSKKHYIECVVSICNQKVIFLHHDFCYKSFSLQHGFYIIFFLYFVIGNADPG